jgi:hypothetical protein
MVAESSTWGAPRIHGELKMLGFDVSERTVLRWMRKAPRIPEPAAASLPKTTFNATAEFESRAHFAAGQSFGEGHR